MVEVLGQVFPFFALIALGYGAARSGLFSDEATGVMTAFVFRFALPAMLFRFASGLTIQEIFDGRFVAAYWLAGIGVYSIATAVALVRRCDPATAAVEAQCATFGNSGFLAIPLMVGVVGDDAVPSLMMILTVDMVFFGNLLIILLTVYQEGLRSDIVATTIKSLLTNPMVMSMLLGLIYSSIELPHWAPADRTLDVLGAAATPCALFAIGASLASRSAERLNVAAWLSTCKLVIHPALAFLFAFVVFSVERFSAGVMVSVAAMPTAGNIYIVARYYNVATARVSATILVSTLLSVVTLTLVLNAMT